MGKDVDELNAKTLLVFSVTFLAMLLVGIGLIYFLGMDGFAYFMPVSFIAGSIVFRILV